MEKIPDFMWKEIKKILPKKHTKVGRPSNDSRKTMNGILHVIRTGIPWKCLPRKYGAHTTVHGTFMRWGRAGVFNNLLKTSAAKYLQNSQAPLNWFATDTSSCKAPFARWSGKNPTDRGKQGIKKGIIVDRKGVPLAVITGSASAHDSKFYESLLIKLRELPIANLSIIAADAAYDNNNLRKISKEKNVILLASTNPRRKKDSHIYRPTYRWVVERTFGWLQWYRGLKICWAKTEIAFVSMLAFASVNQLFRMLS